MRRRLGECDQNIQRNIDVNEICQLSVYTKSIKKYKKFLFRGDYILGFFFVSELWKSESVVHVWSCNNIIQWFENWTEQQREIVSDSLQFLKEQTTISFKRRRAEFPPPICMNLMAQQQTHTKKRTNTYIILISIHI